MADAKAKEPAVSARVEADGGVSLGVTLDGGFVPLHTTAGYRVAQLAENEANTAEADNGNDAEGGS